MIVIMGVSGCGKTTIGERLAKALNLPFYDADDFHPPSNIDKMKHNIALTDADREPWLQTLAYHMSNWDDQGGAVLSCSALKASYRTLLASKSSVTWVYLKGSFDLILSRLKNRKDHYMKSDLLQSQFDTLEEPENGIHISIDQSPEQIIATILSKLQTHG